MVPTYFTFNTKRFVFHLHFSYDKMKICVCVCKICVCVYFMSFSKGRLWSSDILPFAQEMYKRKKIKQQMAMF